MGDKPKLVVMLSRFPFPLEKGDKLRAYYQIKEFSKSHNVYLFAVSKEKVSDESRKMLENFCVEIHVFPQSLLSVLYGLLRSFLNGQPFQVGYFYDPGKKRKINRILKELKPDHIFCQQIRATEYVKDYHYCPKTLDYMDALSKAMERRLAKESTLKKWLVKSEMNRLKKYERSVFSYFEFKTIISEQDRDFIFHPDRSEIIIVPNGIEQEKFIPLPLKKTHDLVFVGNLSYIPNIEAIQMIDRVLQKMPHVTCLIAGADASSTVKRIADKNPQITLVGWVDDIRKAYCSAKIFIAPMMINVGMQNKLLEAMTLEIPCVTTTLANNAIKAIDNESVLLADTTDEFVEKINFLLNNPSLAKTISTNAKNFVNSAYTWESSVKSFTENW